MTTLDGLILALVALQALGTAWIFTRSLPIRLDRTIRDVAAITTETAAQVKGLRDAWDSERAHLAAITEHMEDVAETLQKRRARIVAENRRAEHRDDSAGDPKQALRRRAGMI